MIRTESCSHSRVAGGVEGWLEAGGRGVGGGGEKRNGEGAGKKLMRQSKLIAARRAAVICPIAPGDNSNNSEGRTNDDENYRSLLPKLFARLSVCFLFFFVRPLPGPRTHFVTGGVRDQLACRATCDHAMAPTMGCRLVEWKVWREREGTGGEGERERERDYHYQDRWNGN